MKKAETTVQFITTQSSSTLTVLSTKWDASLNQTAKSSSKRRQETMVLKFRDSTVLYFLNRLLPQVYERVR